MSTGHLQKVKDQGKFQTFSYKSGHGRLREVPNNYYSDLTCKLLVFLENWFLRRGGRLREVVVTGGSTVLLYVLYITA